MDEQWLGKGVDLNCGVLGVFQGVIDAVNLGEQTITIKNVIHDVRTVIFKSTVFILVSRKKYYSKTCILIYASFTGCPK